MRNNVFYTRAVILLGTGIIVYFCLTVIWRGLLTDASSRVVFQNVNTSKGIPISIVSTFHNNIMKDTLLCISNRTGWLCYYAGHDDFPWVRFSLVVDHQDNSCLVLLRGRVPIAKIFLSKEPIIYYYNVTRPSKPVFFVNGALAANWTNKNYSPNALSY
jgi:hypothetical protein